MFDLLISRLCDFADDNNLIVETVATDGHLTYTVQGKNLAWGYRRVISRMHWETYAGDRKDLVEYEISRLRKYLLEAGLI